ncbi:MAG: hypothetical protein NTY32_13890 [Bacteroidia bacterium]|nr:hypothetical protein [Bacteroidia bacterium]
MKKGILALATAILAFAFTSCYDFNNDTSNIKEFISMATVTTGGVNPVFQIDNGPFLTLEKTVPADTFAVGERYYLYYILGDTVNHPVNSYPISMYQYGKTTIKNLLVLPKDSTDKWKDQPIRDLYAWYTGHYLNTFFTSFAGVSTPNTFELVRMKQEETSTATDTVPKLFFEIRHNVEVISSLNSFYRFYSFDLSSLTTEFPLATKFQINLSWNDANYGPWNKTRTYIPEQTFTGPSLFSSIQKKTDLSPSPF